jgi:hypothetical protein
MVSRILAGSAATAFLRRFPLCLAGTRKCPNALELDLAKELPGRFGFLKADIQRGLFEHYKPYKETWSLERK